VDRHHAAHVAAFITELFGGPKVCTKLGGSHAPDPKNFVRLLSAIFAWGTALW